MSNGSNSNNNGHTKISNQIYQQQQQPKIGLFHTYNEEKRLCAFESGDIESPLTVIFIGGLGDGFYSVPYLEDLSNSLNQIGWSLTQVLLSSSYFGFGSVNLDQDVKELKSLLSYYRRLGKSKFVFLGHSTGCQDIIQYFNTAKNSSKDERKSGDDEKEGQDEVGDDEDFEGIIGIILQAPVSDREYIIETLGKEKHKLSLEMAKKMVELGQPQTPIPQEYSEIFSGGKLCYVSSSRWFSLSSSLIESSSSEDFFTSLKSTDLSPNDDAKIEDLQIKILHQVSRRKIYSCVFLGENDETMSTQLNKLDHLNRLINGLTKTDDNYEDDGKKDSSHICSKDSFYKICSEFSFIFKNSGHQLDESRSELCEKVLQFITKVSEILNIKQ